jgi:hypothetical protein
MSSETINVNTLPTVFDVWQGILDKRPEIVRQTVKLYSNRPHGAPDDQRVEVLPIERIKWSHDELQFFGNHPDVKAIGATVEVRPRDFDPQIDYSGADRWFNGGDILDIDPRHQKSFIAFDFESPPSNELLQLTINSLKDWGMDWYLLDSGGSFHLVIDKLVNPKDLPKYFGQLIMDISKNLSYPKAKLYGHIGKYLILNSDNPRNLTKWADSVLEKFGHVDDHPDSGKLVFPIDMRYLAHVIQAFAKGNVDEGYLRVSSKHGSVPVLIAQQVDGKVIVYECQDDPFDRRQPRLPGF